MEQLLVPAATGRPRSATSAFGPDWAAGAKDGLPSDTQAALGDRQQARARDVISGVISEPVQDDSLDAAAVQGGQHQPWQPV